jgi:hypothetical protein
MIAASATRAGCQLCGVGRSPQSDRVLPVPSEAGYQLNAGGQVASLRISERDVHEGRLVLGPHFE